MTAVPAVITIGIGPYIEIGPVTLAWHGLTMAIGIVVGGLAAVYEARRRGLEAERLYAFGLILMVGTLVGGAFYLLEHGRLDALAAGSPVPASPSTAASSPRRSGSSGTSDARG